MKPSVIFSGLLAAVFIGIAAYKAKTSVDYALLSIALILVSMT